jgi:membrane glycosyltransferase
VSDALNPWNLDRFAGRGGWRRFMLFVLVAATAALGGALMWTVIGSGGVSVMEAVFLVLFVLVFVSIALSFWSGVFGFFLGLLRLHPLSLRRRGPAAGEVPPLRERTAILIPVYNEDPAEVFARLERTWRSLDATGRAAAFHFFVLSDTRDEAVADAERQAFALADHVRVGRPAVLSTAAR